MSAREQEERDLLILTSAMIAAGMCADRDGVGYSTEGVRATIAERAVDLARRIVTEVDK